MNVAKVMHRIVDLLGGGRLGVDLSVHSNSGQEGMKSLGERYKKVIEFRVVNLVGGTGSEIKAYFVDRGGKQRCMWLRDVYMQRVFILVGVGVSPALMFFLEDENGFALYQH